MPPQAFYLVPVPDGGRPDQGLPPGYPNRPDQGLPPWERPDGGGGHPWWGGGRPDRPSNELPGSGAHPWWGGLPDRPGHGLPHPPHYPSTGPVFPPIYPVDPDWGIGVGGGVKHPLLWLLPWLISPATMQSAVPEPPEGEKPDPDAAYLKVLVAVGPGKFQWAWVAQEPVGAAPK